VAVLVGLISSDAPPRPIPAHPYGGVFSGAAIATRCPAWITDGGLSSLGPAAVPLEDIDQRDAQAVLAARWPFVDALPGLAPAVHAGDEPAPPHDWGIGHLALVPVSRPADIPAALGWCGLDEDVAGLCAVLRSWEKRFRAFLVRIDLATLWLSVAAPPVTEEECLAVAVEHVAYCRAVDLRVLAQQLGGDRTWKIG